jgi:c(7)-type cytochrome triheme protein
VRAWWIGLAVLLLPVFVLAQQGGLKWPSLLKDGNHDPLSPAVELKQNPEQALSLLPPDLPGVGNQVRWVQALREGYIEPRAKLYPSTEVETLDLGILFVDTASMNFVLFPHRRHTEWLDCKNCHGPIFKDEAGTTPVNMFSVLMGEHCGRCHGAVAFPLTECGRCHSVKQDMALLKRGEREMDLPGLSPYQDSSRVVLARPKSDRLFRKDAK